MHINMARTTVRFAHPFQMDGLNSVFPAGKRSVAFEADVIGGMFLPESPRTTVVIRWRILSGEPGYVRTSETKWDVLEAALTADQHGAAGAAAETGRAKAPFCSTARLLLQADGVSEDELHDLEALEAKRKSSE